MTKIKFSPTIKELEGVFDPPQPSSAFLPEWYKRQSPYTGPSREVTEAGDYNHTVKQCMPVFDAMTAGYIIPLPQDVEAVANEDGSMAMRWPSDIFKQFSSHSPEQISELPLNTEAWDQTAWKFHNPWIIKTPPGYSCLFVQPMWHEDLPFRCFSGVVDTDVYNQQPINFPCVFRKGFRGTIPMGTPMIQVIPFKREDWKLKIGLANNSNTEWEKSRRRFGHRYKKDYRQKKSYR